VPAQCQLTSVVWQDGRARRYHHKDARWPQAVTALRRALRADGSVNTFTATPDAQGVIQWQAEAGVRDILTPTASGWDYKVFADDSVERYDSQGRLLSITERNGWVTTLTYSTATTPVDVAPKPGLLIRVANHFGRTLTFGYEQSGRLAALIDPAGGAVRYGYDGFGNLASVTWQDNTTRSYRHEDSRFPGHVTGITDEAGVSYSTYTYDAQGRVASSELSGGAERLTFSYGSPGSFSTVYDASGSARSYSFVNSAGVLRPTAVSAPCPSCGSTQKSTVYDAALQPTKQIAHDGSVAFVTYDAKGRETERATFASSYASSTTRPALASATQVVSTQWHATFNLPTQVAEPNKTTANTYNAKGLLTGTSWTATTDVTGAAKFTAVKTGSTYATTWSYSASSLATTVVTKETAAGTTTAVERGRWTVTYKIDGGINKITDAISTQSATLTADASGLTTKITASNGAVATFTGNTRGQMIKAVTPRMTTDFSIDALGLTNEIRFSDGRWIRYTYNASRRIIKITDSNGQVEQYAGLEPSWFLDEKTIRTAAAWLSLRGKRFAAMLIPEAKAQAAQILIPAGIIFGLILIFEGQRRNGAIATGGASCCGQEGTPGLGGGDETLASRWSRQITTLLSDQTAPAQSTPAPIYDKAGLLISPKACIPPPGYCDPNKWKQLQDAKDLACNRPRSCKAQFLGWDELRTRAANGRECVAARDRLNKTCFAGADETHRNLAIDALTLVVECESQLP
jgi:YD repeat-containing protein